MAMIGHKTESIYRRYSIVDQAMLEMGTLKLEALQQGQRSQQPVVVPIHKKRRRSLQAAAGLLNVFQADAGQSKSHHARS